MKVSLVEIISRKIFDDIPEPTVEEIFAETFCDIVKGVLGRILERTSTVIFE